MGTPSSPDKRIRGRRGMALRKRRLQAEPLCRICRAEGRTTAATTVDHIKPLAAGGEDVDGNCQGLCEAHHAAKTAAEGGKDYGQGFVAATHPEWLRRSAIPVEIVCGPPASGKTTHVRDTAKPGDTVIDLDDISKAIDPSFKQWRGRDTALLVASLRVRNDMLGRLDRKRAGKAWLIVSAPTKAERQWWQAKLGGKVTLLNPGYSECVKRSKARGTPSHGVERWFTASAEPWRKQRRASEGWD